MESHTTSNWFCIKYDHVIDTVLLKKILKTAEHFAVDMKYDLSTEYKCVMLEEVG